MRLFCIIETDDGLLVVDHAEGATAADAAEERGGTVADAGPYHDYDEAYDALLALQQEMTDETDSDVPGSQALEGRYETDD